MCCEHTPTLLSGMVLRPEQFDQLGEVQEKHTSPQTKPTPKAVHHQPFNAHIKVMRVCSHEGGGGGMHGGACAWWIRLACIRHYKHLADDPLPQHHYHQHHQGGFGDTLLEEAENKDEDGDAGADHVGVDGGGALRLGGKHGDGDWSEVRRVRDSAEKEIQIFVGSLSKRGSSCLTHLSPLRDAACLCSLCCSIDPIAIFCRRAWVQETLFGLEQTGPVDLCL